MKTVQKAVAQLSLLFLLASGAQFLAGCETPSGGGSAGTNNIEALKAAANGGDADAALKLGDIYLHGRGVPKNFVEAETWHKKATELYQKK
jgi:TPR repeat protein